jgi:hypothetical protein
MEAVITIDKNSKVADVVAYVGWKRQHDEFVDELKGFIEEQAINGGQFLSLTHEKLVIFGLRAGGKRCSLLELVEALKLQWSAPHTLPLKRQERWQDLFSTIPELMANPTVKKPKYVALSSIKLDQVSHVFNFQGYVQKRFPIPEEEFTLLYNQLNVICKGSIGNNDARKLHLIAPVLWCLTKIVPGLKVTCEEVICGKAMLLRGKFEFVLHNKMLRVDLVEAKEDKMNQAFSELLMGQEVLCETIMSKTFLGVISTFQRWDFIRNEPDTIFRDDNNYILYNSQENGERCINKESLRGIVEKFYGLILENNS